jgi:rhodanese-related sulfurtransferase
VSGFLLLFALAVVSPLQAEEGASPLSVDGAETIGVEQAHRLFLQGVPFVDVRNPRLYARRHVPGAHHLDLKSDFDKKNLEALVAPADPVVIYCSGVKCSRSATATDFAVDWGFTQVKYFREGIVGWRDAGLPLAEAE